MKKCFLDAIVLVLHIDYCFFTGKTNIQKFQTGTSRRRLWDPVAGRLGDQTMRR